LVERELSNTEQGSRKPRTFIDASASKQPDWFYEKNLPLENRKEGKVREPTFEGGS